MVEGSESGENGILTGNIEDIVEAWWSRYCPSCKTRYSLSDKVCPEDGTTLRDLSISTSWREGTSDTRFSTRDLEELQHLPVAERPPEGLDSMGILGGKWRIDRLLGQGSFGLFFQGHHEILGMKVGIKILRQKLISREAGRLLFHQEALRVSLIQHPNIVKVLDYGQERETPYLVMEFLPGKPLHHHLQEGTLSLDERVEVVRQVAVALIAAHGGSGTGNPLVHLDLKPEHIFLEEVQDRWQVKVIDFGLAEIFSAPGAEEGPADPGKQIRRVAGTIPYMAPERWKGAIDPRCDIYSLGVILYEVVSGRKPFDGDDPLVLRRLHEELVPEPPSLLLSAPRTAALRELDTIILRCLEKDPEKRPQRAAELAKDLERWLARPRRGSLHRMARFLAIPALFAILTAGIFFWAPWEKVLLSPRPDPADPLLLGKEKKISLEVAASGWGYEEGEAFLRLVDGEGRSGKSLLPWKARRTCEIGPEDVKAALGEGAGGVLEASILLRGRLGRSIRSDPFKIELDHRPPSITPVGAVEEEASGKRILWLPDSNLLLLADEDLGRASCLLDGEDRPSVGEPKSPRSVAFSVPRDAGGVRVSLFDLAGNETSRQWEIRWDEKPMVVSERKILTWKQEYPLRIRVMGSCARIHVDGSEPKKVSQDKKEAIYEHPISFSGKEGRRKAVVTLWSENSARRDLGPDQETAIEVEYRDRDLKIVPEPPEGKLPEAFRLVDESGTDVDGSAVKWSCRLFLYDGKDIGVEQIDGSGSRLPIDLLGKRGKLWVSIEAKDSYGKSHSERFGPYGETLTPEITRFEIEGEDGTRARPLLNKDCLLRKRFTPECDLRASVLYAFQESLDLDLFVNDPGDHSKRLPVEIDKDGRCRFSQEDLLKLLVPGENTLYLVARDRQLEGRKSKPAACPVWYEEPLDVTVQPKDGSSHTREDIKVEVRRLRGPKMERVRVLRNGDVLADATGPRGDVFQVDVAVSPARKTDIEVQILFGGERSYQIPLSFSRDPVAGKIYVFSAGIRDQTWDLDLRYLTIETGAGFWITPETAWKGLAERFRRAAAGREFRSSHPDAARALTGVCWSEAEAIARWVTEELRAAKLIGAEQKAELPAFRRLEEIHQSASRGEFPRSEWTSSSREDRIQHLEATYAEQVEGKLVMKGADRLGDCVPFRLILPGSLLKPHQAGGVHE